MFKIQSDVQADQNLTYESLDFVGMSEVQTLILITMDQKPMSVPVKLKLGLNLLGGYRGIHMSRLFQLQTEHLLNQNLTLKKISAFLQQCIASQNGLSTGAKASLQFDFPVLTKALKSESMGFRNYPVQIRNSYLNQELATEIEIKILYSSTCPQSTKLSKEYMAQVMDQASISSWLNSDSGFPATPHAQRSLMTVSVQLKKQHNEISGEVGLEHLILKYIRLAEASLKTPVQTAVKKSDEMEFARLNGENPMFCEDAVRTIAIALKSQAEPSGFKIVTEHQESLHPHNAIAEKSYNYINF